MNHLALFVATIACVFGLLFFSATSDGKRIGLFVFTAGAGLFGYALAPDVWYLPLSLAAFGYFVLRYFWPFKASTSGDHK